jgi:drug/metabolite transporter (DMT)-like permease
MSVFFGVFSIFLASMAWMAAITKFKLSYAYPFMNLSFMIFLFLTNIIFKEPLSISKVI